MPIAREFLKIWIPLAVAGFVVIVGIYGAVQQSYRQNANDPQIELAENAVAALESGYAPAALLGNIPKVDMSRSLSIFAMVFDDSGALVDSSAIVGSPVAGATSSAPLLPPAGIFDNVRSWGEERFTWQTAEGQRYATVVMRYKAPSGSGFFLAARSLREVESRTHNMLWKLIIGGIGYLVLIALATMVSVSISRKEQA